MSNRAPSVMRPAPDTVARCLPDSGDLLAEGARLLHVGPHKTGTTAVQGAFHLARPQLAEHGVHYAGVGRQPLSAALAVTGRRQMLGLRPPNLADWRRLVAEVAAARDQRVVVSSEFFADADERATRQVVDELGGSRVHVVVTLRPLARIMPSQWQQYVQNGTRWTYEDWLEATLGRTPGTKPPHPTFWWRHHHDRLVDRWVAAVGRDNLTVIVVDESDRTQLLRAFERLVGLPGGLLRADEAAANRSLTRGEAEFVRLVNEEFTQRGWPERIYNSHWRSGAILQMKTGRRPDPHEPKITTPAWALDRAAEIGVRAAERIAASGVRIIGDIALLTGRAPSGTVEVPSPRTPVADATSPTAAGPPPATIAASPATPESAVMLPAAAAAQAVVGAIIASGDTDPGALPAGDRRVRDLSTGDLLGVILHRVRRRTAKAARRTLRRLP